MDVRVDFTEEDGPPVKVRDLAVTVGVTPNCIRDEIEAGELKAYRVGKGKQYRIAFIHAKRYLIRIGVLTTSSS